MQLNNHDKCPKCKQAAMPRIAEDSCATAASCQNCGFVLERRRKARLARVWTIDPYLFERAYHGYYDLVALAEQNAETAAALQKAEGQRSTK